MPLQDLNTVIIQIHNDEKLGLKTFSEQIINPQLDLLSNRLDEYSYYPTGEINIILITVSFPKDHSSTKSIKHYIDGTQPTSSITSKDFP